MSRRKRIPELMDQPELDPEEHRRALGGLRRINAVSRSDAILWPALRRLARRLAPRPLRVLDVASGGGDVAAALARRARRAGLPMRIEGRDVSTVAVAAAREQYRSAEVDFVAADVLRDPLPSDYDVVVCSLFLHHLDDAEAEDLLRRMAAAAGHLVLVNDLRRTTAGYAMAWLGCRLLSRSHIVHVDGPVSVAAAFTVQELRSMAGRAGLTGATVSRRWPQRLLLTWWRT